MTLLFTYVLGIAAAACICSGAILIVATAVYLRDLIDARRRMAAPSPVEPSPVPDSVWEELERVLAQAPRSVA